MAQSGCTPVQLYRSTTAAAVPLAANLAAGELAINLTDEKLYFENASGVVKVLADSAVTGTVTSVAASGGTTGLTFSGSPITSSGTLTLSGTLAVANGGTGATTLTGVVKGNGTSAFTAGTVSLTSEVSGTLPVANGGTGVTTSTGTVAVVLSNSPTLVTPNLGTPSAVTLTNATGLPLTTGVTGTLAVANGGTGTATAFTAGSVVFAGASGVYSQNNGQFFWDGVNSRLGIGTTSPTVPLEVAGSMRAVGLLQRVDNSGLTLVGGTTFNTTGASIALRGSSAAFNTYGMEFYAGGSERMRIDSSGNVGIGTSSPDANAKLDVAGTVRSGVGASDPGTGAAFYLVGSGSFQTVIGGAAFAVNTGANNARTERMRIASDGNVGIGTSSPTYRLDIVSGDTTASVGYAMRLRSNATATAAAVQFTNSAASAQNGLIRCTDTGETVIQADGASSLLAFRTNGSERMRIDSSGNVGIGTTSISYKLEVAGDVRIAGGGGDLRIQSATGTTSTGGDSQIYNDANNMIFTTGTTTAERMRIGSSGDVGIGTSSPSSRLEVAASSGSTQVAYFINNSAGSTLAGIAASIESGGNNTNSFHFAGVTQTVALWYLYGNGTTSYTSDIRVKKNVTTTRDGYLEDVCKLRVVKYNWYNDSDETPRELGFIAQEVEQVFPGLVQDALHPTKDGEIHKVLKGSVMMPIMLKALQEASAKIDALTARVAQLEGT